MKTKLIGVILAAGEGSRIRPFSEKQPKPLLPICNKPLIEYQIESMKQLGIKEIIILIGSNGFVLVDKIGSGERFGVKIRYVEQKERLGIAHAVGTLEQYIKQPFLLFLGDIFFITKNLSEMVNQFKQGNLNVVLATKIEKDKELIKKNFSVITNEEGYVKRVIEKPRYVENNLKGCGLYLFDLHIFDAIRRTPRTAMRDEYEITEAIQIMLEDGSKIKTSNIVEEDINLTFPKDLLDANLMELDRRKEKNLIGKESKIPQESLITNSVIGDNVTIKENIKISNSLILPNTIITSKKDLTKMIISPEHMINCNN
jgi:dTDP-glucose pyrophosphorylase